MRDRGTVDRDTEDDPATPAAEIAMTDGSADGPAASAEREKPHDGSVRSSLPTADGLLPTRSPIGLVGPMSNYATPPQWVESVPYHDIRAMHAFARQWRDQHRGKWSAVRKLSGFCLLMKRAVYETIGGLDERFGIGFFDDDDLAERARRAGFGLAVAHDLFVHHFGSRTFQGNGIDAEKLLDENARRFAAKWGLAAANGKRVALRPWPGFLSAAQREFAREVDERASEEGEEDLTQSRKDAKNANGPLSESNGDIHVRLLGEKARVTLTLIVRDEEKNLPRCLASVRGVFDEIVVVDTGSQDRTAEIARSFGARVFDFVWVDDFAAARNEALAARNRRLCILARCRRCGRAG